MNYNMLDDDALASSVLKAIHGDQIQNWCLSECETYVFDCGPIGEDFHRVDLIDVNNPLHVWPIIVEHKLNVTFSSAGCGSQTIDSNGKFIDAFDEKPLRAALVCFLNMLDSEK